MGQEGKGKGEGGRRHAKPRETPTPTANPVDQRPPLPQKRNHTPAPARRSLRVSCSTPPANPMPASRKNLSLR